MDDGISTSELLGRRLNDVEERYAPPMLFFAGDRTLLHQGVRVAIVGREQPSEEGALRARRLAALLASHGIIVVSGMARGVDTEAHTGSMEAGGRTVGVAGCGLDRSSPRENGDLRRLMMARQLVVSQFSPGTPPLRSNFPRRNRVMALASDATVIVEAGEDSGTQAQAWETLRLGRLLFLMQSVFRIGSTPAWATQLVRYGARVLREPTDLLEELPSPEFAFAAVAF